VATTQIRLVSETPFKLASVMHSHGWIQLEPFSAEAAGSEFRYVDTLPAGRVVVYRVREDPMERDDVLVTATSDVRLPASDRTAVIRRLRWMLGLDMDLREFHELAGEEPKLADVRPSARGRFLRSPTLWEDIVKTILTTNVTWSGTVRMVGALTQTFGEPWKANGQPVFRAFPTPERIAAATPGHLAQAARVGYRAPYIHNLAVRVAGGELDLESYKDAALTTEVLRRELGSLQGVGPYATATLLTLLGRYEFIPVDSWALTLVSHEWYGGEPIKPSQVEPHFERWGAWKALAYWFWDWDYVKQHREQDEGH
jgi:3-methyladenine DNA glycosylase/8-oxoguanine DNA glycosylase